MPASFLNDRFFYFSTPRVHVNVVAWVKPPLRSETERSTPGIAGILRWEDDGGRVSGSENPLWNVAEPHTPQRLDASEE